MDDNTLKVSIFNSDLQRNFDLFVRKDRLKAFYDFTLGERHSERLASMPGLSWAAISGLDAVFERRPKRFPVHDIIAHLAGSCTAHALSHDVPVTPSEIEYALERFSAVYPPDVSESA
jgi:hypothetical protein